MHLGFGSPDLTTLMKRLPADKVPMLIGTAMVGLVWQPKGWHFSIRPTYSHEFAALLSAICRRRRAASLLIGAISTQTAAGFVDQVKGVEKLAATYPDRFEVVDTQWVDGKPGHGHQQHATLDAEASRRHHGRRHDRAGDCDGAGAGGPGSISRSSSSSHNGLSEVAKGIDLPSSKARIRYSPLRPTTEGPAGARDLYEANKTRTGKWGLIAAQSAAQALLALRVLEQAIAKGRCRQGDRRGDVRRAARHTL